MKKLLTKAVGATLCFTGAAGFLAPTMMGMVLNPVHNCFLLAMGLLALGVGQFGTEEHAQKACCFLGVMFALLGLVTLCSGAGSCTVQNFDVSADHFLKIIPGHLEYSTADGIRDLLTGLVAMLAFLPNRTRNTKSEFAHAAASYNLENLSEAKK